MWHKRILIMMLLVTALVAGVLLRRNQLHQTESHQIAVSDLPDFQFPDVTGKPQSIKQWHNKVLVINFWATWCPPCLEELPEFNRLQVQFQSSDVQFIGVALDEVNEVQTLTARLEIVYPQLIAGDSGIKLSRELGNHLNALPFTILVDQQGHIYQRHAGSYNSSELQAEIAQLLKKY